MKHAQGVLTAAEPCSYVSVDPPARNSPMLPAIDEACPPGYAEHQLTLAALATATPCARMFTRHHLRPWGIRSDLIEVSEILVSELVTNAVKMTGVVDQLTPLSIICTRLSLIIVRLRYSGDSLLIEVWDRDRRLPVLKQRDLNDEGGRGLMLVKALSKRWGHYPADRGGKVVWCELDCSERKEQ